MNTTPVQLNGKSLELPVTIFARSNDGTVITIEMQVVDQRNIPKRLRYYSSMSDSDMLDKGVLYSKLKDNYVIIICPFDFYKQGLHKYTFTNRCHEVEGLEMADGTTKIVLNANSTADDVNGPLREFLDYVAGKPANDEYTKKVDAAVYKARQNKEWRREYMTLFMRDLENREMGIEEGIEQGKSQRDKEKIEVMLRKGRSPEEIADFCDYPLELVQAVQDSLLVTQ
jgi:predicted transposase/invertase (TIGR01784 family)